MTDLKGVYDCRTPVRGRAESPIASASAGSPVSATTIALAGITLDRLCFVIRSSLLWRPEAALSVVVRPVPLHQRVLAFLCATPYGFLRYLFGAHALQQTLPGAL